MNLKKYYILGVVMLQLLSSCAKIDKFNKPHMLEGFIGIAKLTPGIEGITAKTYAPASVFFNSNKDGTEVTMYGPNTENFSLYSIFPDGKIRDLFRSEMSKKGVSELDKLDFSGYRGHVDSSNGKTIKIYAFGDQSEGMKKFKWNVTGSGLIDGPDSHVRLTISTTVGILQDLLPKEILKKLGTKESGTSLADIEKKDTIVFLAQIEILGESLTFGY